MTNEGTKLERRQVIDKNTGEIISEHERHVEQNKDFVQLYRGQLHTIATLGRSDPLALAIWLWIVERMGRDNALVCSMQPLIEHFEKSRQTISKKVSLLRRRGYLGIAKTGTTNVYLINAEIAWTASATSRRRAEFRANVVLAESEQMCPADETQGNVEHVHAAAAAKKTSIRSRRIAEA